MVDGLRFEFSTTDRIHVGISREFSSPLFHHRLILLAGYSSMDDDEVVLVSREFIATGYDSSDSDDDSSIMIWNGMTGSYRLLLP